MIILTTTLVLPRSLPCLLLLPLLPLLLTLLSLPGHSLHLLSASLSLCISLLSSFSCANPLPSLSPPKSSLSLRSLSIFSQITLCLSLSFSHLLKMCLSALFPSFSSTPPAIAFSSSLSSSLRSLSPSSRRSPRWRT